MDIPIEIMNEIFNYLNSYDLWIIMPRVCMNFRRYVEYRNDRLTSTQIYMLTAIIQQDKNLIANICKMFMAQKHKFNGICLSRHNSRVGDGVYLCSEKGCYHIECCDCANQGHTERCGEWCDSCTEFYCSYHIKWDDYDNPHCNTCYDKL